MQPRTTPTQGNHTGFLKTFTAALAWLGLAAAIAIGAYIITIFLNTLSLGYTGEILYAHIIAVALSVVASGLLLLYGGYHTLKGNLRRAGIENTVASFILLTLFLYFYAGPLHFYVYTELITTFGPTAWLLFTPALTSGIIALSLSKLEKKG